MPYRSWLKLATIATAAALFAAAVEAWRADRRDRAQLAAELASTKQLLAAADARQRDRDAQLAQTLSALDAQKRAILTPAQILRALPKTLPLPVPLTVQSARASSTGATLGSPAPNASPAPTRTSEEPSVGARCASPLATTLPAKPKSPVSAVIPAADLRPLYDFTLDCQACQAKLSTAQNDFADEKSKTAALTKERDDALRLAKGGSAWRRVTRAAKWFLLGAAAGAIAAKTTR